MLAFFKKFRKKLLAENKLARYLAYAVGEIILVVIGILIALQINTWNNRRIAKQDEKKIYRSIRQRVLDDKDELIKVKDFNSYYADIYNYANKIIAARDRTKTDSLALFAMGLSQFSDFHRSGTIYETLVNSGELRLLKNYDITSAVQQLETTYIFVNKLEDIHWELIINELSPELRGVINYNSLKAVKPDKLYGVELQNIFVEIIGITKWKDGVYNQAIKEIDTIIGLIDEEVSRDKVSP